MGEEEARLAQPSGTAEMTLQYWEGAETGRNNWSFHHYAPHTWARPIPNQGSVPAEDARLKLGEEMGMALEAGISAVSQARPTQWWERAPPSLASDPPPSATQGRHRNGDQGQNPIQGGRKGTMAIQGFARVITHSPVHL